MNDARRLALVTVALGLTAGMAVLAQSVVSTHSGLVYFFTGTVFLGGEKLEQRFGRFPDMREGRELRTALGRAEVQLTPGVFLRLDENSSIRLLSSQFTDTQVELLAGSAILEATEKSGDTSVKLIYKNWQVRVPMEGTYRIDTAQPRLRVYKGEVKVAVAGRTDTVTIREGEDLPLAEVLVPETATNLGPDDFKVWAMTRSQAISADNAISAGIVDDPRQADDSGLASGGYTYFPMTGIPSMDIGAPYGLSFWSPYQSMLNSVYFPVYLLYRPLYGSGWPAGGWQSGIGRIPRRSPLPISVRPTTMTPRTTVTPRFPAAGRPAPMPRVAAPAIPHR